MLNFKAANIWKTTLQVLCKWRRLVNGEIFKLSQSVASGVDWLMVNIPELVRVWQVETTGC